MGIIFKCLDVIKYDLIGFVCKICRESDYICNMSFNIVVVYVKVKDMENDEIVIWVCWYVKGGCMKEVILCVCESCF